MLLPLGAFIAACVAIAVLGFKDKNAYRRQIEEERHNRSGVRGRHDHDREDHPDVVAAV